MYFLNIILGAYFQSTVYWYVIKKRELGASDVDWGRETSDEWGNFYEDMKKNLTLKFKMSSEKVSFVLTFMDLIFSSAVWIFFVKFFLTSGIGWSINLK